MSPENMPRQEKKEKSVFEISQQAVDSALSSIAKDAFDAGRSEAAIIHNQNLELELYLLGISNGIKDYSYRYLTMTEGTLYAHRIMRLGAEEKNETLPRISQAQIHTMQADSDHRMRFGKSFQEDLVQSWDRVSGQPNAVTKAVEEIAKYRSSKDWFYAGAGLVIEAFQKHEERELFNRQFNS